MGLTEVLSFLFFLVFFFFYFKARFEELGMSESRLHLMLKIFGVTGICVRATDSLKDKVEKTEMIHFLVK